MPLIKSTKSDNSFTGIWHLTENTNINVLFYKKEIATRRFIKR